MVGHISVTRRSRVGLIALALLVGACSGGSATSSTPRPTADAVPEDPCLLVKANERVDVLGQTYQADEDASSSDGCLLRGEDGQSVLAVRRGRVDEQRVFESMVAVDDAEMVEELGDDARFWADEEPIRAHLLVRVGGSTLQFELSGPFPFEEWKGDVDSDDENSAEPGGSAESVDPDSTGELTVDDIVEDMRARLLRLARSSIGRLPELPFGEDAKGDVGKGQQHATKSDSELCESIDVEDLDVVVGAEPGTGTLSPLADTGSIYSGGDGVTLVVEALPGEATAESLDGFGREMIEDGETFTWVPEDMKNLGDGAVWLADPRDDTSGELYVLFNSSLLRVASSVPAGGDGVRAYAEAAAVLVSGQID